MRLWSIHPKYLDSKGLVALWRESLLAQAVLSGQTKGYTKHPQLLRFKQHEQPFQAITTYLAYILQESKERGYRFDETKVSDTGTKCKIKVTKGQVDYEWGWLREKLKVRDPSFLETWKHIQQNEVHPLFEIVDGGIEAWEKMK
ncbi:hypothetical protein SAMN04487866_101168 [Thermoactinomyces sp. DSM 45891]|uniref:pyrimidine dimer DNA glycosylase/endonuclease V n=1 Tax=Thermoactinomyces sp. DSM 45891 TaxID=1761907 RepID=UPI000912099B|nr:pyrimidine dimer DNA glycosylase/endonuclease V [Thermoactinomyces sp. DSM 45891]SFX00723.1 hypothetical protein SAMN04487866_101168 [Thermoactinomyces sp. DSM 45891]